MTRNEAIDIQNKCDKLISDTIDSKCEVSMALTGKLKVSYDSNFITFAIKDDGIGVDYISYTGWYEDLMVDVDRIRDCLTDNFYMFNQLMWSYRNIDKLEDCNND